MLFIAFAFGCNIGCSVVVSQLFGGRAYGEMKTAVTTHPHRRREPCVWR